MAKEGGKNRKARTEKVVNPMANSYDLQKMLNGGQRFCGLYNGVYVRSVILGWDRELLE